VKRKNALLAAARTSGGMKVNRSSVLWASIYLVAALVFLQPATAQVLGSISGFVTDDSNAALPGVSVEA